MHAGEANRDHASRYKHAFYTGIMYIIVFTSIARVLELWKGTGLSGKMKWTRIQCWFTYISMPAGVITDIHVSRYKHTFYTRMMSIIVFTLTARGFEIRKGSGISSKNIHQ